MRTPWNKKRSSRAGRVLQLESLEARTLLSANELTTDDDSPIILTQPVESLAIRLGTFQPPTRATNSEAPPEIASLDYTKFANLDPSEVHHLSIEQIASIPSSYWLALWPQENRDALTAVQVRNLNTSAVGIRSLNENQIALLLPSQIQQIEYEDFTRLPPEQIIHLSPQQVSTIPSSYWLASIPTSSRNALTEAQVPHIRVGLTGIRFLTSEQLGWLSPDQVRSVATEDFPFLGPDKIVHLTSAQLASIPSSGLFGMIPTESRHALTAAQVRSLSAGDIGLRFLTQAQIDAFTPEQIRTINFEEFRYLSATGIVHLTPTQVATIPDSAWFGPIDATARAALTGSQVRALDVANIAISFLTPEQISLLTAQQIGQIDYTSFQYLGPSEIPHLTSAQLATIPTSYWLGIIPLESRSALTAGQVAALRVDLTGIRPLPQQQISYLQPAQVQQLSPDEFQYLGPNEIVHLTPTQLTAIASDGAFGVIPKESRAGLTASQIQSLNVRELGLRLLTPNQRDYLSPQQVASLRFDQFQYLGPVSIVHLTPAQVASIPSQYYFGIIPTQARYMLDSAQVQAINTNEIDIAFLSERQAGYLSASQVAQLDYNDFAFLPPEKIEFITPEQMATIPSLGHLMLLGEEARNQLSREQFLAIRNDIAALLGGMATVTAGPESFSSSVLATKDGDGLATDARTINETNNIFSLVPQELATHATIASGSWSDPSIWRNGLVPTSQGDVLISAGHSVVFDLEMPEAVRTVRIDGALRFATNRNTSMLVDTIFVDTHGTLEIGTQDAPIAAGVSAEIVFSAGEIDTSWDPRLLTRGLLGRGTVRMVGQEVTSFVPLEVAPVAGDVQLHLSQIPTNWNVGDTIVITATDIFGTLEEERTIVGIDGSTVTVDKLEYNHRTPSGVGAKVYVANTSRNVTLRSANPDVVSQRGHIMFVHNPDVKIANVALEELGRTDKTRRIDEPRIVAGELVEGTGTNQRGRYAIHFHRTSPDPNQAPATVRGSVVIGSPGWGFVNHASNVIMEDNVGYGVVGATFTTEDGNEIGAMRRNLAIRTFGSGNSILSRQDIHDFAHSGHGFWLQGPGVELVDNIATGHRHAAFVIFTASSRSLFDGINGSDAGSANPGEQYPVETVPLAGFTNNIASASAMGLELWFHLVNMPDGHSTIDGFTSWNTYQGGVRAFYSANTTFRNMTLSGNMNSPALTAIRHNSHSHDIVYENPYIAGFENGIFTTAKGDFDIRGGYLQNVNDIIVTESVSPRRNIRIDSVPEFAPLSDAQLNGRTRTPVSIEKPLSYDIAELGLFFTEEASMLGTVTIGSWQLYHAEQRADYIPFTNGNTPDYVPDELVGKTNQQLWAQYGIAPGGLVAPAVAVDLDGGGGLIGRPTSGKDPLIMRSRTYTNQLADYAFAYSYSTATETTSTQRHQLDEGWNVITEIIGGERRSFLIYGDTSLPSFVPDTFPLRIRPDQLGNGFLLEGAVQDESFGELRFRKNFSDLTSRTVIARPNGSEYVVLSFQIGDIAGNTRDVSLFLEFDDNAPVYPPFSPLHPTLVRKGDLRDLELFYLTGRTEDLGDIYL